MSNTTRQSLVLLLGCALLTLFFHQATSGNGVSRLLTVWALVEDHTLVADRWKDEVNDVAIIEGHHFSDKAPASSFVVLPFYWIYRALGSGPQTMQHKLVSWHIAVVVCGLMPYLFFLALLIRRLRRAEISEHTLPWWLLAAAFSTFAFNYANTYFGHVLSGAFFLGAYVLVVDEQRAWFLAGLLAGLSVDTEYPMALAVMVLLLWVAWRRPRRELLGFIAGGAIPAALLLGYNKSTTGSFFKLTYFFPPPWYSSAVEDKVGYTVPHLATLWDLLFSQFRGAFFFAPLLFVLVPSLLLTADDKTRARRLLLLAIVAVLTLNNASYNAGWWGGWCTGPRHLVPAIFLLLYEGLPVFIKTGRAQLLAVALAAMGIAINLLAAATDPLPSDKILRPVTMVFVPALKKGAMNAHTLLAEWFGLSLGAGALVVWAICFVAVGLLAARLSAAPRRPEKTT